MQNQEFIWNYFFHDENWIFLWNAVQKMRFSAQKSRFYLEINKNCRKNKFQRKSWFCNVGNYIYYPDFKRFVAIIFHLGEKNSQKCHMWSRKPQFLDRNPGFWSWNHWFLSKIGDLLANISLWLLGVWTQTRYVHTSASHAL